MHTLALPPQRGLCRGGWCTLQALGCAAWGRARTRKELVGVEGVADHLSPQIPHSACKEPNIASSRGKAETSPLNCTIRPQLSPPLEAGSSETMTNPKVPVIRPGRQPDIHAVTLTQTHKPHGLSGEAMGSGKQLALGVTDTHLLGDSQPRQRGADTQTRTDGRTRAGDRPRTKSH